MVALVPVLAQSIGGSKIQVDKQSVTISDNQMILVGMDITVPADMEISSDRVLTLTPVLQTKDGSQNKVLPQVVVYGRRREIIHEREGNIPTDAFQVLRRQKGVPQTVNYTARVPFEPWMNGASLDLMADLCGCANHVQQEETFIDNVSIEYRLDNSGTRYVKLFHDKNYESILEGEVIETGVGIVLRKKVSKLGELFIFKRKDDEK